MNAISKAMSEIFFSIPKETLQLAFNDNPAYGLRSIDETIMSRVIRPRVLVDCNLVGGVEVYIPVNGCRVDNYLTPYLAEYVITVPKSLTGNRSIITALGLIVNRSLVGHTAKSTELSSLMDKQMTAVSPPTMIATSRMELIGENMILIADPSMWFVDGSLKVIVENSDNLSNISPRSYLQFSKLVILATKAYIHNQLIIKIGKGYIQNGHELSVINDTVADYSSANTDYNEFITTTWAKVAYHNDPNRISNFITGLI
jgi:hypothetical protein